jgi:hypothetical protein
MASANLKNGSVTAAAGVATFVPAEFQIAKGSMAQTPIDAVGAANGTDTVEITFSAALSNPSYALADKVLAAVYNQTQDNWGTAIATDTREDGSVTVTMPSDLVTNNALKVYLAFYNTATGKVSTSVYFAKSVTA